MKTQSYSSNKERMILTALVVNDEILGRIAERVAGKKKDPFRSPYANLVATWCFEHFAKYGKAPNKLIETHFEKYAKRSDDDATVSTVESFLRGLSAEYSRTEETNVKFTLDQASEYLEMVQLERLGPEIESAIARGDVKAAKKVRDDFEPINLASTDFIDPFAPGEIRSALAHNEEDRSLVRFAGDLDKFLSPYFSRGGFVSFIGPEKAGKSFWLLETLYQGLRARRRVLYYVLGDMGKEEVCARLYARMTGCTWERSIKKLDIPVDLTVNRDDPQVQTEARDARQLTAREVSDATSKLCFATGCKALRLKLQVDGGGMVTAGMVERKVQELGREGFPPDLVIIDYADELAAEPSTSDQEKRHQTNETWRVLRRTALLNHCLVVTATQAATTAYKGNLITKGDFSESKTKNAHVTGMLGINRTDQEKEQGLYRLNWVLLRGGGWSSRQVVWCAGNLAVARPAILSKMKVFNPHEPADGDNEDTSVAQNDGKKR